MRVRRRIFWALLILLSAATAAPGQELSAFAELTPLPLAVGMGGLGEPLPFDTLIQAALEFSGTPESALFAERQAITAHLVSFRREAAGVQDQGRLAEMALVYLHRNVLQTYRVLQTRVDIALDTGSFNCVSSAVLYLILARSVGLVVGGVRTVDHAFCTVLVDGAPVDVETTSLYGFDPGTKKQFKDSFGKVTGYSYVPPSSYADRRPIGEKELLSLVLSNRVAEQTDRGGFREALPIAASAYALMGNAEYRQTLSLAVSNYAVWLAARGNFNRARGLLDAAEASYGPDKGLDDKRSKLFHNQVIALTDRGSLEEARRLLGQSALETPLDGKDWMDLSVDLVLKEASDASRTGDFPAAARIVAASLDRLGREQDLLMAYEAYVHNQVADLFNALKFSDARRVLLAGLSIYSDSRVLRQDMGIVEKALRQQ